MKQLVIASLFALGAAGAFAQNPHWVPPGLATRAALCENCGTVQSVKHEKRKGEGGAVGIVAGAAAGGLLGNQVGKGNGRTLATVGGAVAGGFVGNEVQKHVTSKKVWVTQVKMRDGALHKFEQETQPAWKSGSVVRVHGKALALVAGT